MCPWPITETLSKEGRTFLIESSLSVVRVFVKASSASSQSSANFVEKHVSLTLFKERKRLTKGIRARASKEKSNSIRVAKESIFSRTTLRA